MITDFEAALIYRNNRMYRNAGIALDDAYDVAHQNAAIARQNARAASAARSDAAFVSEEYDRLLADYVRLQHRTDTLRGDHQIALSLLSECLDLLDQHGLKLPAH